MTARTPAEVAAFTRLAFRAAFTRTVFRIVEFAAIAFLTFAAFAGAIEFTRSRGSCAVPTSVAP